MDTVSVSSHRGQGTSAQSSLSQPIQLTSTNPWNDEDEQELGGAFQKFGQFMEKVKGAFVPITTTGPVQLPSAAAAAETTTTHGSSPSDSIADQRNTSGISTVATSQTGHHSRSTSTIVSHPPESIPIPPAPTSTVQSGLMGPPPIPAKKQHSRNKSTTSSSFSIPAVTTAATAASIVTTSTPVFGTTSNNSSDLSLDQLPSQQQSSIKPSAAQKPSALAGPTRHRTTSSISFAPRASVAAPWVDTVPVTSLHHHKSSPPLPHYHIPSSPSSTSLSRGNSLTRHHHHSSSASISNNNTIVLMGDRDEYFNPNFTGIPGFPINDDTRSIRTVASTREPGLSNNGTSSNTGSGGVRRSRSVSKLVGRLRGEVLTRDYWMKDENAKNCYDCKSVFTTWRRKHHCRICGQIFCGRCASNIIKGYRFGHEGMVRVCNLCLEKMDEYDDDDDAKSISSNTNFQSHHYPQITLEDTPDSPYSQSPFAASKLFTVSTPNYHNLGAISEGGLYRTRSRLESLMGDNEGSRPATPDLQDDQLHQPGHHAPFRRTIAVDDDDVDTHYNQLLLKDSPNLEANEFPKSSPLHVTSSTAQLAEAPIILGDDTTQPQSFISFPRSDSIEGPAGDENMEEISERRARLSTLTRFDSLNGGAIPLVRNRLSSRALGGLVDWDPQASNSNSVRARSGSVSAPSAVLEGPSLVYFKHMLRQALDRAGILQQNEWFSTLLPLLIKVSTSVSPSTNAGDAIDIRNYVKIKKIPGGRISESEYVSGCVITKNVAHKKMARNYKNARVMILTFPLEYHRVEGQLVSMDPLVAQEKEYLRGLVNRIAMVRPHVVLVEKTVSRLALEFLLSHNIAVSRSVKFSALQAVARCTQADIISSMDRLATDPRLGRCAELKIQTFEHELIPGWRKSYMRFEGCPKELGATILLRGADFATLRKVKDVTDFMVFVIYNLKNEMFMWSDVMNMSPPYVVDAQNKALDSATASVLEPSEDPPTVEEESTMEPQSPDAAQQDYNKARRKHHEERIITRRIRDSLVPYLTTSLSISSSVRFQPPFVIQRMFELDTKLYHLRIARDEEEAALILKEEQEMGERSRQASVPLPNLPDLPTTTSPAPELDALEVAKTMAAPMLSPSVESGSRNAFLTPPISDDPLATPTLQLTSDPLPALLNQSLIQHNTPRPSSPNSLLHQPEEIEKASAVAEIEAEHEAQLKVWEWYTSHFGHSHRPEDNQGLVYLSSYGTEGNDKFCTRTSLESVNFYQDGDMTLGQWVEQTCAAALLPCPGKMCDRLRLFHYQILVHDHTRLQIAVDKFPCAEPGLEEAIITWTYCKSCLCALPTALLSPEACHMSWGKYLETSFYPPENRFNAPGCPHDIARDHIRYFAHRNLAIRIHNEAVDVFEVVLPTVKPQVRSETKVLLKNQEIMTCATRAATFWDSVKNRLKMFDLETVDPSKVEKVSKVLDDLLDRLEEDRGSFFSDLSNAAKRSSMTEVLAINPILVALQNKVVQWDETFNDLERNYLPSDKDLRRLTEKKIRKMFANQDSYASDRQLPSISSSVSEVDEKERSINLDSQSSTSNSFAAVLGPPGAITPSVASPVSEKDSFLDTGLISSLLAPAPISENKNEREVPAAPTKESYDSDSTISAMPTSLMPLFRPNAEGEASTSGIDSDLPLPSTFISRLPRRTASHRGGGVADLVKKIQAQHAPYEDDEDAEGHQSLLSRSNSLSKPHPHHHHHSQVDEGARSESEAEEAGVYVRPRMRRGRTEGTFNKKSANKDGILSDGADSYAARAASRIPTLKAKESSKPDSRDRSLGCNLSRHGSTRSRKRSSSSSSQEGRTFPLSTPAKPSSPHLPSSRPTSPSAGGGQSRPPMSFALSQPSSGPHSKKEILKGKERVSSKTYSTASVGKPVTRRVASNNAGANRVSTIARHFDRLSREAERDRQRRITLAKSKRAKPVGITKATVKSLDLRDAVKDDSDSSSSDADDEDEGNDRKRVDSDATSITASSGFRRGLSQVNIILKPNTGILSSSEPEGITNTTGNQDLSTSSNVFDKPPIDTSEPVATTPPLISKRAAPRQSVGDHAQLNLAALDTTAPLPSAPETPLQEAVSTTSVGGGAGGSGSIGPLSESEFSSAGGAERQSILKTLSGFWAFRGTDYFPLEYPINAGTYVFEDSSIVIREDEPTSIIAFTLSSKNYGEKLRAKQAQMKARHTEIFGEQDSNTESSADYDLISLSETGANNAGLGTSAGIHGHQQPSTNPSINTYHSVSSNASKDLPPTPAPSTTDEPIRIGSEDLHLQYDFESGGSTIFCRVFFMEQFDALRRACGLNEGDAFIESLARCIKWESSGGKSGSAFLKTKDDRFIAKELSRLEMDALTTFAPAYFDYMAKSLKNGRPSVLAKIFGVYKIGYRTPNRGSMRMNVLVMENLFYERRFSTIYDLKGNMRNRHVEPTGKQGEVLLDENLVQRSSKYPIFMREHSKKILRAALWNDTLFLSSLNIMDYSLVVGVDQKNQQLVVGIVDYIRTYTWDKKLESVLKESTFLGGKGESTITTPRQYKTRFRASMDKYFSLVPDHWMSPPSQLGPVSVGLTEPGGKMKEKERDDEENRLEELDRLGGVGGLRL